MPNTIRTPDVATSVLALSNSLPYPLRATTKFDTGIELLRKAGGPLTRLALARRWDMSHLVVICSPEGARDILGRNDENAERGMTPISWELRKLVGDNLLVVPHREWLPQRRTLQPIFAKQHVPRLAGHMAEAAEHVAGRWIDDVEMDLDAECRTLTLRALSRSMLGLEDDGPTADLGCALRTVVKWATERALRPVNAPRWLPTRQQRQARAASAALHELAADVVQACRADQARHAPVARALMQTADPQTGEPLTDSAICDELVLFMIAGHQTTSIALTYALWALGHHHELQERVAAEVGQLGNGRLTHKDVSRLGYTVQVLHEALRLCPPVPVVERFVMKDVEVDGHRLDAGTLAIVAIHAIHRDPTFWEDPLTFNPDRFAPGRANGRNSWQYLPFGGGPRACIGDHFALIEATLALAAITRECEIHSLDDDFPVVPWLAATVTAPIRARVRQRKAGKPESYPGLVPIVIPGDTMRALLPE
ncbi:cytochrome P450 [Mycobacterium celatum]|uniref:Cytochrome P450 n=1 Tax=Mycobacterium celatum TaxID=28045 RepID=A0A2G5PJU6_MYCCE|nr:cytochrome P450 [Mycobacterium celatum]PIB78571.1 cytochrome P450 [Mycobacterium celatum]